MRYTGAAGQTDGLSNSYVYSLHAADANGIWIGAQNGLNYFDHASESFTHLDLAEDTDYYINNISSDDTGRLWIASSIGVYTYDPVTMGLNRLSFQFEDSLFTAIPTYDVLFVPPSTVYIGTAGKGLLAVEVQAEASEVVAPIVAENICESCEDIYDLELDDNGSVWAAAFTIGLLKIEENEGITSYQHAAEDPFSLSSNRVRTVHQDNEGQIWVGTDAGLNLWLPARGSCPQARLDRPRAIRA